MSDGLTQRELLDMFDRTAPYPGIRAAIRAVLQPDAATPAPTLDDNPDETPWGETWRRLDAIVPHYPEDDDDLAEIRRMVNGRMDARGAER